MFNDLVSLFVTAFVVGFTGALMPGPLLAVTIAESPKRGKFTGPILVGGHAIAELAVIIVLSLGVSAIIDNKTISNVIGVAGGAMLILMGLGMLYDLLRSKLKAESANQQIKSNKRLVLDGIITSLSNPYWYVWWATVGAAFMVKALNIGKVGPPVFYVGHILSDFVWYTAVSIIIWTGRKIIIGTVYKILISLCALFLLYLGGLFIHDGLTGAI
jgi:threonine/homoserine/homoserine lactone efflux protein